MSRLRRISEDNEEYSIFSQARRKVVKKDHPRVINITLPLYRGFDADLNKIKRNDQGLLIFSPAKSEQGLLWFTHMLIGAHDPVEYAKAHGEWLLSYPLDCRRHIERIWYDDGDYYDDIPEEIRVKSIPTENCKYYMGIELPDGWIFSYKSQKFIGCSKQLLVNMEMISKAE